ncbi:hypothetical protein ACPRNU_25265 [Chromobacterium vaccinii]|uniref:DUF4376 domain-containing protein n=1 Tax=Chromobacterium vaccinii TaxID=1108595 RepID=UPI003C74AD12
MIYYSKSTGGFYDDTIHHQIPADAVNISADVYTSMMSGQAAGQVIACDAKGNPMLIAPAAPTLAQVQATQEALLQTACQEEITAGFTSAALGAPHEYPSQLTDQQNLMSNLAASQGAAAGWQVAMWCAAAGAWSYQPHTAAQLAALNADWVAARSALQQRYAGLVIKVQAATTVAAVQAITWS